MLDQHDRVGAAYERLARYDRPDTTLPGGPRPPGRLAAAWDRVRAALAPHRGLPAVTVTAMAALVAIGALAVNLPPGAIPGVTPPAARTPDGVPAAPPELPTPPPGPTPTPRPNTPAAPSTPSTRPSVDDTRHNSATPTQPPTRPARRPETRVQAPAGPQRGQTDTQPGGGTGDETNEDTDDAPDECSIAGRTFPRGEPGYDECLRGVIPEGSDRIPDKNTTAGEDS